MSHHPLRTALLAALAAAVFPVTATVAQTPPQQDTVAPSVDRPAGEAVEAAQQKVEASAVGDKITTTLGVDVSSHFISYGSDVWAARNKFFGDKTTVFAWGEFAVDLDPVTITAGLWSDNNDNDDSPLGGPVQEIDVYVGTAVALGKFTVGATYQGWYYLGDAEYVLDISAGYDDTGLIAPDFALNPSFLAHVRTGANGDQEVGATAFVLGVEPSFEIFKFGANYPLTVAVPVNVGLFTDDFYGGGDAGFGFASLGGTLSVPLAFIPEAYGAWTAAFNVTGYTTNNEVITPNQTENFVTGQFSLSATF